MWERISAWFGALATADARAPAPTPASESPPPPPPPPGSPSPPSPPPSNPEPKACIVQPPASALPTLTQYVIDAYIDLVRGGVLENSGALEVYNQGQRMLYAQPEQDPLGVLSTTLFFLRFHEVCDLSWRSRRTAAVALTAFHKLCTSQRALRSLLTVERVVRRFLLPREEAVVRNLGRLVDHHVALECHLACHCELLHVWQTSPMAGVEERLWELLNAGHLSERAVIMIRGVVFFFLANALLDGDYANNFEKYTVYDMGCGVVGLAIICARRAWHDMDHCSDLQGNPRHVAITLLSATRRTQAMRVAAYADSTHTPSAASCVAEATLDAVAASLEGAAPPRAAPPARAPP